jgi:hypothetical protein
VAGPDLAQPPRLALRRRDHPGAPVAVAVRLVAHELLPREPARVVDDLSRRVRSPLHRPHELPVELLEQLGLVARSDGRAPSP